MEVGNGDDGSDGVSLETVRVLHQTVVTLRSALEQSKNELHSLREKVKDSVDVDAYTRTIESLSIENHILRQKVLNKAEKARSRTMSEDSKIGCESESSGENDVFEDEMKDKINGLTLNVDKIKDENSNKSIASNLDETLDTPRISKGDSEESEEVDDIELIFTTDDTKELGFQEDLVSIAETDGWKHKDEDISEKLKQTWSQSVLVETDISKCGVIDENEPPNTFRRNTLPAPMPYRPIIHREYTGSKGHLSDGVGKPGVKFSPAERSPRTVRPILTEKNITKQESEAQTDITAVPIQWRSESYLAHHKVSQNFTTLPSKFTLPFCQRKQSLRLCEKTQEARRVLLSDINFTSMVPELSRSADHLCQENLMARYPRAFSYMKNIDARSPCDCGRWESNSPSAQDLSRRHSMRPSLSSLDHWASFPSRPTWASVPSSPTHFLRTKCVPLSSSYTRSQHFDGNPCCGHSCQGPGKPRTARINSVPSRHKVKFTESKLSRSYPGQSLPDLRGDESEESTESLIDESEDYLRRSIDSILTGAEPRRRYTRSHSQPDCNTGVKVPRSAQPYLARAASDLHTGHWVKVILSEGKTATGLVRYVGPLPGSLEQWLGVQLPPGLGNSDGSFQGARYFDCDANSGMFVPFKKVIMAWSL